MKKRTIGILLGIILFLVIVGTAVLALLLDSKESRYNRYLSLGDKYLEELDYEGAIAAYSDAINILPKNEDAYIQLSNVYVDSHDYENARKVLGDYTVLLPDKEQSEEVQKQYEFISEKENEYRSEGTESEPGSTLPAEENGTADSEDVIAIAVQTLGMEYCGGMQQEHSFEKVQGEYGEMVIISPVASDNILSAVKKDFDGDGQDEILVVVRSYHPDPLGTAEYNSLAFYMLEYSGDMWISQDHIEIDKLNAQGSYNSPIVPKTLDFYLKEIENSWMIYFEGHELARYFSDGYGWTLFGCSYSNNKFEQKFETIEIVGSSIEEYLYLDINMVTNEEELESVRKFIERVNDSGININRIDMEYPTMEADPDTVKICRITYTSSLPIEAALNWQSNSASRSMDGIIEMNIDYQNADANSSETEKYNADDYFDNVQTLVGLLGMDATESWQFGTGNSYVKDEFYLEWQNANFSMKNDGCEYIALHGISIGDHYTSAGKVLAENGWVRRYEEVEFLEGYYYGAVINDDWFCLEVQTDGRGNINYWYLNNWPQGDDVDDFYTDLAQQLTKQEE